MNIGVACRRNNTWLELKIEATGKPERPYSTFWPTGVVDHRIDRRTDVAITQISDALSRKIFNLPLINIVK